MTKKALTSFAYGNDFVDLLQISLPTFYEYANYHNYDLIIPSYHSVVSWCFEYGWDINRPISWLKIPIIKKLLNNYDIVQWIDADIIIHKIDLDITKDFINSKHIHALIEHQVFNEGLVPNAGVWSLKRDANKFLEAIWNEKEFINHKWWEQGAMIKLINDNQEDYLPLLLPYEFNVHKNDVRFNANTYLNNGRFLHATMWDNRLRKMTEWAMDK